MKAVLSRIDCTQKKVVEWYPVTVTKPERQFVT